MSENDKNNIKVRWFYIAFGTITLTLGAIFWFQGKLDAKADLSIVKNVCVKQEKQDDILMDIRQRLIRIETLVQERDKVKK